MKGLTGLSLSGFEVFDAVSYIPVRRLTLLFGPNSAGKSAFEDALLIAWELCWQPPGVLGTYDHAVV
jgi:predicted ATPase